MQVKTSSKNHDLMYRVLISQKSVMISPGNVNINMNTIGDALRLNLGYFNDTLGWLVGKINGGAAG